LTYNANLVADYASLSKTFGIDHVGFNTDLAVSAGQITPPTGWKMSGNNTLSGFGQFTWGADGSAKGGSRINPATVLITGLGADATVSHFLINSQGAGKNPPSQGAVYFAMHVAGFTVKKDDDITSHWVGGSGVRVDLPPPPEGSGDLQPTPEPASILLFALGALGIAFRRRFWRARDAA
jgi:hypothetical protein